MSSSRKLRSRSKSKSRSKSRSKSTPKNLWLKIVKKHGYMIKGDFKKIPKKGTKGYDEIYKEYQSAKKKAEKAEKA